MSEIKIYRKSDTGEVSLLTKVNASNFDEAIKKLPSLAVAYEGIYFKDDKPYLWDTQLIPEEEIPGGEFTP